MKSFIKDRHEVVLLKTTVRDFLEEGDRGI